MVLPVRAVTTVKESTYRICDRCTEYPYRVVIDTPWGRIITLEVCREHASEGFAWLEGFGRGEQPLPMKVGVIG